MALTEMSPKDGGDADKVHRFLITCLTGALMLGLFAGSLYWGPQLWQSRQKPAFDQTAPIAKAGIVQKIRKLRYKDTIQD